VDDCASESLAKTNLTMCGLFNSTLSGHTFLGMYGTAKGANARSIYTVAKKVLPDSALSTDNTMIFGLADGTIIGFNKNATNCSVMPGTPITADILNGALANCVGFIDVNGPNPPNKEVTCDTQEYTTLDPTTSCALKKAVSDVFPIVFHNGTVQPASNAANVVLSPGGKLTEAERTARRRQFDKWEAQTSGTLTQAQCEALPESYGVNKEEICGDGYGRKWAAAVKKCGGVQNLPTENDLWELAKTIYTNCNESNKTCTGYNASKVPPGLSGLGQNWENLWSSKEKYVRHFSVCCNTSFIMNNSAMPSGSVVCVGDL